MPHPDDDIGQRLADNVRADLARAAMRTALDSTRPASEYLSDAMHIFSAIFALSGDSAEALAEAEAWLASHPMLRREGAHAYVESWVFYKRPDWWDG